MRYSPEFNTTVMKPLYQAWADMHRRCSPGYRFAHRYFNRGITVCPEWSEWPVFCTWALASGWARGLEIDRTNNNESYRPDNCRFVDDLTQTRNRDVENMKEAIRKVKREKWKNPILCIETGVIYNTQVEASLGTGVQRKSLREHLRGQYSQAGGFHWKYVNTEATQGNALSVK